MKLFLLLLCLIGVAVHEIATQSATYEAAVIEVLVNEEWTDLQRFENNTAEYIRLLELQTARDILVFPESTLNNEHTAIVVPQPHERIIPCGNITYNPNLQEISCAVQIARKYVVVNLVMKRNCTVEALETNDDRPCASDWNYYNTNVVFDRNGMVISLYRKFNVNGDDTLNQTLTPDVSTFTTDFEVTFGHFTGIDSLFESPASELLKLEVRNFIYPVRLPSEMPFLTALQIQEGWAITHNVNLLAASANQPTQGISGSGIYSGNSGALRSFVTGAPGSRSFTYNVPKIPGQLEDSLGNEEFGTLLPNLQLVPDPEPITVHRFIITGNTTMQEFELCEESRVNRFCCNFRIQVAARTVPPGSTQYWYAAVLFNGHRTFGDIDECFVRVCAVVACIGANVTTCVTARPTDPPVQNSFTFTTINIRATGAAAERDLVMPTTLATNLLPFARSYYNYVNVIAEGQRFSTTDMNLTHGQHDLLTFGVYIRDFTFSSAVKPTVSLMALIVTVILYFK